MRDGVTMEGYLIPRPQFNFHHDFTFLD